MAWLPVGRYRVGTLCALALVAAALCLESAPAQGPFPPGGPMRPPNNPPPGAGVLGGNPNPGNGVFGGNPNPGNGVFGGNPNPGNGVLGGNPNPGAGVFGGNPNPGGFNPRMPGTGGPVIVHVWKCSGCGNQIGTGDHPPGKCPFCGATIINGFGPAAGAGVNPPPQNHPGFQPPINPPNNPVFQPPINPPNNNPGGFAPPNNDFNPPANNPVDVPQNVPVSSPAPFDNSTGSSHFTPTSDGLSVGAKLMLVGIALLAGLVLLLVIGVVAWNVWANNRGGSEEDDRPGRRRRRHRQTAERY